VNGGGERPRLSLNALTFENEIGFCRITAFKNSMKYNYVMNLLAKNC
jgi:hypothetical protein